MPTGSQPRRARGTVEHPYSALNLRLLLASFGFVACGVLTVILGLHRMPVAAVVLGALALTAVVDIVVIQRRRRQRRRETGQTGSLFE